VTRKLSVSRAAPLSNYVHRYRKTAGSHSFLCIKTNETGYQSEHTKDKVDDRL
jgi:hypothetical protein